MPRDAAYKGFADIPSGGGDYNELEFVFAQLASRMATSQPVLVKAVGDGTVDIQPMVAQIDGDGNATLHGIIHNVPVLRIQGGHNAIIITPVAGDIGLAVIASRDISSVKANKAPSNPGSRRRFDWADAVYIGGILNSDPTQYIRFNSSDVTIETPKVKAAHALEVGDAPTGVFVSQDGKTITVTKGIVTLIV